VQQSGGPEPDLLLALPGAKGGADERMTSDASGNSPTLELPVPFSCRTDSWIL
jgi:hypothetical protein